MQSNHCIRTVHAEANAIAQAARNGVKLDGCTAYVTCTPCLACEKLMRNAGVEEIVFDEQYGPDRVGMRRLGV